MTAETKNLPAERKPQLVAGGPVAAIIPQTIEETFRLAGAIAGSGMAPTSLNSAEKVMVAIMAGAELGMAPFQSLQSFAVINGKPAIWGDGLMAVVRSQGFKVREWFEGEGDDAIARCEVTRPDNGEVTPGEFSVADAKKAGLWGKAGPWQNYPKRMLKMRARAFALRDGAADVLRGFQIREEVEDYGQVREVRGPAASGLRERLTGPTTGEGFTSANAPEEPVEFAENAEEIADAEFAPTEADVAPVAEEPAGGDPEPATAASEDDFPGDRPASDPAADLDDDPLDWAGSFTRGLASLQTVTEVSAAWSRAKADGHVAKLRAKSEDAAKQLADAVNDRVAAIKAAADQ